MISWFLIKNSWEVDDILSLCMPLANHKIPKIDGALPESYKGIVSSCILLLRQSRLLPAGLMTIISNVALERINKWSFDKNLIVILTLSLGLWFSEYQSVIIMPAKGSVEERGIKSIVSKEAFHK